MSTSRTEPRYPDVTVPLSGQDGNIFFIMGRVRGALRKAGVSDADQAAFPDEVMNAGSYEEALRVVMRWVHVT